MHICVLLVNSYRIIQLSMSLNIAYCDENVQWTKGPCPLSYTRRAMSFHARSIIYCFMILF